MRDPLFKDFLYHGIRGGEDSNTAIYTAANMCQATGFYNYVPHAQKEKHGQNQAKNRHRASDV